MKLYNTKSAVEESFNFHKDYDRHLRMKSLRCQFPIIDMKDNMFSKTSSIQAFDSKFDTQQMSKNELISQLDLDSNQTMTILPEYPQG